MTDLPPLNPLMAALLPEVVERVSRIRREIQDLLQPIQVDMSALTDFLGYEIDRTRLALERAEWSSQADTETIERRIAYLESLREAFDPERIPATIGLLNDLDHAARHLRDEAS